MPRELEMALAKSYARQKRKGKLKNVDRGQYIYGSKPMQKWMKEHK